MNNLLVLISLVIILAVGVTACATPAAIATPIPPTVTATPTELATLTATLTAIPSLTPSATPRSYASAFSIDYGQPAKYLAQGGQTRLSNPGVIETLRRKEQSIAHLGEIYRWIAGGSSRLPRAGR